MEQRLNPHLEPLGNGIEIFVSDTHRFGTDAILLADFADIKRNDRAADLGTGCGIIPFLWCRNGGGKEIYGVEIQTEAADLAASSVVHNSLDNKVHIINRDLRSLKDEVPAGSLTLVTCNPPYKANGAGLTNEDASVMTARHETEGSLADFISAASRLLQTSGRFCMCLRPERLAEAIILMSEKKLEPKRLRLVAKTPDRKPWLFLIEGKKCAKSGMDILPELFMHKEDGSVSDEMERIYGCYRDGAGV